MVFTAKQFRGILPSTSTRGVLPRIAPRISAVSQVTTQSNAETKNAGNEDKIYVGKGRFITDDAKKYPDRTPLTGGFAGGEVCDEKQ